MGNFLIKGTLPHFIKKNFGIFFWKFRTMIYYFPKCIYIEMTHYEQIS